MHDTDHLFIRRIYRGLKVKLMKLIPFPCNFRFSRTRIADNNFLSVSSKHPIQTNQSWSPWMCIIDQRNMKICTSHCKSTENEMTHFYGMCILIRINKIQLIFIPGRYEATQSIFLIEDIHSWLSLSETPDKNNKGFWFLPIVNTPKAYCFVRDSVLQIVDDLGNVSELSVEPSLDDFNVNSTPLLISSSFLISHHCLCHACLQTQFE